MIDYEIAKYSPADQESLEEFFGESWKGGRFPFRPDDQHSDLRNISDIYQNEQGQFWVMRVSGAVVGTNAIKSLGNKVAEVKRFNVLPNYRGKGLGSVLFQHALDHVFQKEFSILRLDSIRNPGPAMHLFEKHGFVEIPRYNDNPNADVFMELALR